MRSFSSITEKLILSCGFHHGHVHDQWRPDMRPYILGFRSGFKMMELHRVVLLFRNALRFLNLSSRLKHPGLLIQFLDADYAIDNQKDFFAWSGLPQSLYIVNHRFGGVLTNWTRTKKQYLKLVRPFFSVRFPRKLFPAFGIALTRPMPYSLIMEFNALTVPLVALIDSNTSGVEDIFFPLVSSAPSQKSAFYFLRSAIKVGKAGFSLKRYLYYPFERFPLPVNLDKRVILRGTLLAKWKQDVRKWRKKEVRNKPALLRTLYLRILGLIKKQRKLGIRRQVRVFKSAYLGFTKRLQKVFLRPKRLKKLFKKSFVRTEKKKIFFRRLGRYKGFSKKVFFFYNLLRAYGKGIFFYRGVLARRKKQKIAVRKKK